MPEVVIHEKKPLSKRKVEYEERLLRYLTVYKKCLMINVDNVSSTQLHTLRKELRESTAFLMGKNTVIRTILRKESSTRPDVASLLPLIRKNVGFAFTNGDLLQLRDHIVKNKAPAAATPSMVAPCDVWLEPGPTGLDPGQTSFFQAIGIATRINKNLIEVTGRTRLVTEGLKVSASAAVLLAKLGRKPFFFGVQVVGVFEGGSAYDARILDLGDSDIMKMFAFSLRQASALALGLGYPCSVSIPHILSNALRKIVGISIEIEYPVPIAEPFRMFLSDPEAFAAATAAAGRADAKAVGAAVQKQEEEEDDEPFALSSSDDDDE